MNLSKQLASMQQTLSQLTEEFQQLQVYIANLEAENEWLRQQAHLLYKTIRMKTMVSMHCKSCTMTEFMYALLILVKLTMAAVCCAWRY